MLWTFVSGIGVIGILYMECFTEFHAGSLSMDMRMLSLVEFSRLNMWSEEGISSLLMVWACAG